MTAGVTLRRLDNVDNFKEQDEEEEVSSGGVQVRGRSQDREVAASHAVVRIASRSARRPGRAKARVRLRGGRTPVLICSAVGASCGGTAAKTAGA